jgi:hypothetical protein
MAASGSNPTNQQVHITLVSLILTRCLVRTHNLRRVDVSGGKHVNQRDNVIVVRIFLMQY